MHFFIFFAESTTTRPRQPKEQQRCERTFLIPDGHGDVSAARRRSADGGADGGMVDDFTREVESE